MIQMGISVFVAPKLPDNLDLDRFILKYGIEAWQKHINNAEHGFHWQANRFMSQFKTSTDKDTVFDTSRKNHPTEFAPYSAS